MNWISILGTDIDGAVVWDHAIISWRNGKILWRETNGENALDVYDAWVIEVARWNAEYDPAPPF